MESAEAIALVVEALEDLKGVDVITLDVQRKTSIADAMIIATGTSQRGARRFTCCRSAYAGLDG